MVSIRNLIKREQRTYKQDLDRITEKHKRKMAKLKRQYRENMNR